MSTSILELRISKEDHGKLLTCSANMPDNKLFPEEIVSANLTVQYNPSVSVVVHKDKDLSKLVEGQSVVLECKASSRPVPHRFTWFRDEGQIVSDSDLLKISLVTKEDSGQYWCEAENSEGVGVSSEVRLVVNYKPMCVSPNITTHPKGFTPGVSLSCEVDSYPESSDFRWLYNSTQGSFEIPNAKSVMSFLNYAVSEGGEQGEVLCWASNEVGKQEDPCVFYVVPLGSPHPPRECRVKEQTASTVHVSCKP